MMTEAMAACPAIRNSNRFQTRKTEKKPIAESKIAINGSNVPDCVKHPKKHCGQSILLPPELADAADHRSTERLYEAIDNLLRDLCPQFRLGARRRVEVAHSRIARIYRSVHKTTLDEPIESSRDAGERQIAALLLYLP